MKRIIILAVVIVISTASSGCMSIMHVHMSSGTIYHSISAEKILLDRKAREVAVVGTLMETGVKGHVVIPATSLKNSGLYPNITSIDFGSVYPRTATFSARQPQRRFNVILENRSNAEFFSWKERRLTAQGASGLLITIPMDIVLLPLQPLMLYALFNFEM